MAGPADSGAHVLRPFHRGAQPRAPPRRGHAGRPGVLAHGRIDLAVCAARNAGCPAPRRAWTLEGERLHTDGLPFWSLHNQILQPALVTLALWGALCVWLGPQVLLFLLPAALWSNFQLTSANYIKHYGLLRERLPNGRFETCKPWHS